MATGIPCSSTVVQAIRQLGIIERSAVWMARRISVSSAFRRGFAPHRGGPLRNELHQSLAMLRRALAVREDIVDYPDHPPARLLHCVGEAIPRRLRQLLQHRVVHDILGLVGVHLTHGVPKEPAMLLAIEPLEVDRTAALVGFTQRRFPRAPPPARGSRVMTLSCSRSRSPSSSSSFSFSLPRLNSRSNSPPRSWISPLIIGRASRPRRVPDEITDDPRIASGWRVRLAGPTHELPIVSHLEARNRDTTRLI